MLYSQLYLDFERPLAFLAAVCPQASCSALSGCMALHLPLAKCSEIAAGKAGVKQSFICFNFWFSACMLSNPDVVEMPVSWYLTSCVRTVYRLYYSYCVPTDPYKR